MRSDAKMQNHNLLLQDKIMEQQEEIKQLRQYLRDIFEQEENKIVAASYEDNTETSMQGPTADGKSPKDTLRNSAGQTNDTITSLNLGKYESQHKSRRERNS